MTSLSLHRLSFVQACIACMLAVSATAIASGQETTKRSTTETKDLEPGFVSLFDGKTLDGWDGNLDWFRMEDGAIVAGSLEKDIPHNEFLSTKKEYGDKPKQYSELKTTEQYAEFSLTDQSKRKQVKME